MVTNQNGSPTAPNARAAHAAQDGEVGYRRPPQSYQFKAGQSGNPKGRPKGAKGEATILRELLNRKITVREGGKSRKVTVLEAILTRIAEDSLKGNVKSAAFVLNRYGAMVSGEAGPTGLSDDDQEILEAYAQRLLARHGKEQ